MNVLPGSTFILHARKSRVITVVFQTRPLLLVDARLN